jgi:hypothetical protein
MYKSLDMDLQAALHLEGQLQEAAYATADHRESVDDFLHKRAAKFTVKKSTHNKRCFDVGVFLANGFANARRLYLICRMKL